MNDERPDLMRMIGLHKLASNCGDGLVAELHELLSARGRFADDYPNVTEFPVSQVRPVVRPPLGMDAAGLDSPGLDSGGRNNILPFPGKRRFAAFRKA